VYRYQSGAFLRGAEGRGGGEGGGRRSHKGTRTEGKPGGLTEQRNGANGQHNRRLGKRRHIRTRNRHGCGYDSQIRHTRIEGERDSKGSMMG